MKRHLRAASLLFNQPLLTTPDMLDLAVRWANQTMHLNIINLSVGQITEPRMLDDADYPDPQAIREEQRRRAIADTGVEVIPVHGVLVSRGAHLNPCETMTSYEGLRSQINRAVADPMVERIVLDIDSPGGSAVGAFELAADIRAATASKPITGLVNYMAYSGGYLIASACSDIIVSQTSGVGSIGVIASHLDRSKLEEGMGVKITTVYRGAHKNDLTPHAPLSEQSLNVLEEIVEESYQMFVSAVADYRNLSTASVMATEAGLYRGKAAISAGLADRLESPQAAVDNIARAIATSRTERQQARRVSIRARALAVQARL